MTLGSFDPRTVLRKLREVSRKLWVRVAMMGFMAVFVLGLTQALGGFVPDWMAGNLTDNATARLLDIIANAMLAVTIFSITIMVSVYQSSSSQWTPRVHRLIIEDALTQNTIAVFVGAYVYALVAIVLRQLGLYQSHSSLLLFAATVLVLVLIVYYLIRWVLHLQSFGSLIATTRQIEEVALREFSDRLENPCLGGNPLIDPPPDGARIITAEKTGYIQSIYPEELNGLARHYGIEIYLTRNIGAFVFKGTPLAHLVRLEGAARAGAEDDPQDDWSVIEGLVRDAVLQGDLRTYSQDPRFGLLAMGEIGSKALSPGINDAGTAIDVVGRLGRILLGYTDETRRDRDDLLEKLYVPPLDPRDLIDDSFSAIARDGAGIVEVQQRLQRVLAALMAHPDDGLARAAKDAAEAYLSRALARCDFAPDRERLLSTAPDAVRKSVESRAD